jgi:hypothetical protein
LSKSQPVIFLNFLLNCNFELINEFKNFCKGKPAGAASSRFPILCIGPAIRFLIYAAKTHALRASCVLAKLNAVGSRESKK